MWGINSFDQYGVELGKALASAYREEINQGRLWKGESEILKQEGTQNIVKLIVMFIKGK